MSAKGNGPDYGPLVDYPGTQQYAPDSLYFYAPNKGAPILFATLFFLTGVTHCFICQRYHAWRYLATLPWASLVFTAGFACRAASAFGHYTYNNDKGSNLDLFIAAQTLLFAGPPIFEISNYLTLGRVMYYVPHESPIHPGRVISTFLLLDAATEAITVNGAIRLANTSNTPDQVQLGETLLKVSLILQIGVFVLFVILAGFFHRRCISKGYSHGTVNRVLFMQYFSAFLILARSTWRVVETFQTVTGYLYRSEILFYIFEGVFMLSNALLWVVFTPARQLPGNYKIYLARDGVTTREGPGWHDKRPFLVTVADPFDLGGIFRKSDHKEKFWETHEREAASGAVGEVQHVDGETKAVQV